MPCSYVIDKERRLVITNASGRVTFAEGKAHQDRLRSDPDFSETFDQLLDATEATTIEITTEQIRELARRPIFSSSSRRAFVATQPVVFGIGRMLQAHLEIAKMVEAGQAQVFYDRTAALKWLGLETDPVPGPSS
jgi:hypothetical protein